MSQDESQCVDASWVQFEGQDAHVKFWASRLMTPVPGKTGFLKGVPLILLDSPKLAASYPLARFGSCDVSVDLRSECGQSKPFRITPEKVEELGSLFPLPPSPGSEF